mgnify:CR=1 FL=1
MCAYFAVLQLEGKVKWEGMWNRGLRHGYGARRELQRVADADQHAEADVEHPELRRRGAEEQADDGDRRAAANHNPRAVRGLQRAGRPGAEEHQTRAEAAGAAQQRARG